MADRKNSRGKVSLVGAGPGDPGLITAKGLERLRDADVVIYDRLASPRLLEEAGPDAELIDVGKIPGRTRLRQPEIIRLLVEKAAEGKTICRLKGGDPFVFGRGGEEALALAQAGIRWEVVPGVTSSIAAAAYAGIPITHRGMATSFTVITGSEDPEKEESQLSYKAIAGLTGTIVFLMGWSTLPEITRQLVAAGMPSDIPCALVQWGTTASQRTVAGPLSDIAHMAEEAGLSNPAAFVVGEVTSLRDELGWFDNRPLFGKKVLVTRTRSQASRLRSLLEESGAECVEFPAISIAPLEDSSQLDAAVANLGRYDWVVFSSSNGVRGLASRLEARGGDARSFAGVKVAAIGPATGETVKAELGISADLVPDDYVSEAMVDALSGEGIKGKKILAIRSDLGRDALESGLAVAGAQVDAIVGYETKVPEDSAEKAAAAFDAGIDITTFTSSSGVDNLVDLLGGDTSRINDTVVACMGPITAERAEERGVRVDVISPERTMEALVESIVEHLS